MYLVGPTMFNMRGNDVVFENTGFIMTAGERAVLVQEVGVGSTTFNQRSGSIGGATRMRVKLSTFNWSGGLLGARTDDRSSPVMRLGRGTAAVLSDTSLSGFIDVTDSRTVSGAIGPRVRLLALSERATGLAFESPNGGPVTNHGTIEARHESGGSGTLAFPSLVNHGTIEVTGGARAWTSSWTV